MVSTDFLVSLTYWPNLWQRGFYTKNLTTGTDNSTDYEIVEFRFASILPSLNTTIIVDNEEGNKWRPVSEVRDEMGAKIYDQYVHNCFTLNNPKLKNRDVNHVWIDFLKLFKNVWGILLYIPARRAYFKQVFKELYEDGVQYVEVRAGIYEVIRMFD